MRTIKALFSAAAIAAITTVLAVSASAEVTKLDADAYDNTTGVITASDYTTTDGQMTVAVVEASKWNDLSFTADDLLYINQFAEENADATLGNIALKDFLTEDVEYYILLGGENAEDIQILSITYTEQEDGPRIYVGDVNNSNGIPDGADLSVLQLFVKGSGTLDNLSAGDTNGSDIKAGKDPLPDGADLSILQLFVKGSGSFGVTYVDEWIVE